MGGGVSKDESLVAQKPPSASVVVNPSDDSISMSALAALVDCRRARPEKDEQLASQESKGREYQRSQSMLNRP